MKHLLLAQAQSSTQNNRPVQRTIIDENEVQAPRTTTPAEDQATNTVLFGLGAIILVVIVVIAIGMIFSRHHSTAVGTQTKK